MDTAEELENVVDEVEEIEQEETAEGEEPERLEGETKVEFDERQQKVFNDAIAKKTAKLYEERQERERLAKEVEELKKRVPQDQRPEVPPMPDPYDPDFEVKVKRRDQVILEQAQFDARKAAESEYQYQQQQRRLYEQQQKQIEREKSFVERSEKLKVSQDELGRAVQTVAQLGGIGKDASDYVMEDALGPQIVMYLAENPQEVEILASLPATKAAVYIETGIKSRLSAKRVVPAPEPPEHLGGKGAAERDRGPKGARFE
jgi:hypothetical protein